MSTKHYIAKESRIDRVFSDKQAFFAAIIDDLEPKVAAKLLEFQENYQIVQRYLVAIEGLVAGRNDADINALEVPACLQDVVRKESPPKKKATGARSKKTSPTKPRKTKSSSSTSQPTEGSDG